MAGSEALRTSLRDALVSACRQCVLRHQGGHYGDARLHLRAHIALRPCTGSLVKVQVEERIDLKQGMPDTAPEEGTNKKRDKKEQQANEKSRFKADRKRRMGNMSTLEWAKRIKTKHARCLLDKLRGKKRKRKKDEDRGPSSLETSSKAVRTADSTRDASADQVANQSGVGGATVISDTTSHICDSTDASESSNSQTGAINAHETKTNNSQTENGAILEALIDTQLSNYLPNEPPFVSNDKAHKTKTVESDSVQVDPNKISLSTCEEIPRKRTNVSTSGIKNARNPDGSIKHKKRALICDVCKKCFTLRTNLTRHMRRMHRVSIETGQPITSASASDQPITSTSCINSKLEPVTTSCAFSQSTVTSSSNESSINKDIRQNENMTQGSNDADFHSTIKTPVKKEGSENNMHSCLQKELLLNSGEEVPITEVEEGRGSKERGNGASASATSKGLEEPDSQTKKKPVQRRILPAPPIPTDQSESSRDGNSSAHAQPSHDNFIYFLPASLPQPLTVSTKTPQSTLTGSSKTIASVFLSPNHSPFTPPVPYFSGSQKETERWNDNASNYYLNMGNAHFRKTEDQEKQKNLEYFMRSRYPLQTMPTHISNASPVLTNSERSNGRMVDSSGNSPALTVQATSNSNPTRARGTTFNHMRSKSADGYAITTQNDSMNSYNSSNNTSIDVVNLSHETSSNVDQSSSTRRHSNPLSASFQPLSFGNRYSSDQNISLIGDLALDKSAFKSNSLDQLNPHFTRSLTETRAENYGKVNGSSSFTGSDNNWNRDHSLFGEHKLRRRPLSAETLTVRHDPPPLQEHPKILSTPNKCSLRGAENEVNESENEHGEPLSPLVPDELQEEPETGNQSTNNTSANSGLHLKEALETVSKKLQSSAENLAVTDHMHGDGQLLDRSLEEGDLSPIVSPPSVHGDLDVDGDLEESDKVKRSSSSHIKEALENVSKELSKTVTMSAQIEKVNEAEGTIDAGKTKGHHNVSNVLKASAFRSENSPGKGNRDKENSTERSIGNLRQSHASKASMLSQLPEQTTNLFRQTSQDSFPSLGLYDLISPAKSSGSLDHSTPVNMGNMSPLFGVPPFPNAPRSHGHVNSQTKSRKGSEGSTPTSPSLVNSGLSSPLLNMPPPPYNTLLLADTFAPVGRFSEMAMSPYKSLSPLSPFKSPHHDFSKFHDFSFMSPPKASLATGLMSPPRFYSNGFYPTLSTSPHTLETGIPKAMSPAAKLGTDSARCGQGKASDSKSRSSSKQSISDEVKGSTNYTKDDGKDVKGAASGSESAASGSKSSAASGDTAGKRRRHSCRAHRFDCTLCDAKFTFRTNLTRHMKKVHDTNPLQSSQEN